MQQYYNNMNGMNPAMMGMGGYNTPGVNMGMGMGLGLGGGQGYYGSMGMGVANQYQQVRKPPMMTQPLTQEQIAALKNKGANFDTKVSREELDISICTHKENGQIVAFIGNNDKFVCPICGESWRPTEYTEEEVNEKVEDLIDHLQMIKLQYLNAPVQAIEEFFPIIPLMRKIGKFTTIAADDFARYDQSYVMNQQQGSSNGYAMINQLTNGYSPVGGYNPAMMGYNNPAMQGYNPAMMQGYNPAMQYNQQGMMQGQMMQPGGMQGVPTQAAMQGQPQPVGGYNPAMQGYNQNSYPQNGAPVNPLTMATNGNEFGWNAPPVNNAGIYNGYTNPNQAMMNGQSNPNIPNQETQAQTAPVDNTMPQPAGQKEVKVTKAYQA